MRVILSMPNDGQSNNYIINALQDSGHEVVYVDHRSYPQQTAEQLPSIFEAFKPDLFLCLYLVKGGTFPSNYIEDLKVKYPGCAYAAWIFDITINGSYAYESPDFIELMKAYDYLFTVAKSDVEKFEKAGIKDAHWVPEGYCPYSHYIPTLLIKDGWKGYTSDVMFAGQFGNEKVHTERIEYLDAIASINVDLKIFGHAHKMTPKIESCYVHRPTHNDIEHTREAMSTKINLCHSGWADVDKYVSARNYRVSAAGGFMLCNAGEGVKSIWEDGKEIVTYDSIKDCLDKIRYYLENEDEREEIAAEGQVKTLASYSFKNSIKIIEDIVE